MISFCMVEFSLGRCLFFGGETLPAEISPFNSAAGTTSFNTRLTSFVGFLPLLSCRTSVLKFCSESLSICDAWTSASPTTSSEGFTQISFLDDSFPVSFGALSALAVVCLFEKFKQSSLRMFFIFFSILMSSSSIVPRAQFLSSCDVETELTASGVLFRSRSSMSSILS